MGLVVDCCYDQNGPNSTPKLSLSKLPTKPREPIQMLTPPLHQSLSVPFRWELAPGKARAAKVTAATPPYAAFACDPPPSKNVAARGLELPPRLVNDDSKIGIMSSPVTVLDGPYVGRSLSLACTFSFRKGVAAAGSREEGARLKKRGAERNSGSGRWGSFDLQDRKFSLGDAFKNEKKIKRFKRRSFFNLSTTNSNIWGDICASFKHVVPWRRRRQEKPEV